MGQGLFVQVLQTVQIPRWQWSGSIPLTSRSRGEAWFSLTWFAPATGPTSSLATRKGERGCWPSQDRLEGRFRARFRKPKDSPKIFYYSTVDSKWLLVRWLCPWQAKHVVVEAVPLLATAVAEIPAVREESEAEKKSLHDAVWCSLMQFVNSFLTCPCTHGRPEAPAAPGKGFGTTRRGWRSGAQVEDRGTTPGLSGRSRGWVGSSCSTRRCQAGVSALQWLHWGTSKSCYANENLKGLGTVGWSCEVLVFSFFLLKRLLLHPSKTQSLRLFQRFTWSELHFDRARHMRGLVEGVAEEVNETVWLGSFGRIRRFWVLGFKQTCTTINSSQKMTGKV